ncbi:MAG TPA: hypothetical protein VJP86_12485 [Vicinamibacterales bacterium]|jgi:hypothetical protein|nr:hypothetical protein [Vicinamibacterales bacterium]
MTPVHRRTACVLFVFFQALYGLTSSGNAFHVPDEFEVYYQTEHLADAGDLSVPQALARNQFFGLIGRDQKPYAPYGPLAAFLALPHHLAARGVAWAVGVPRNTVAWGFLVSGLTMLNTATAAALTVAGFYCAAILLGAASASALLMALLLGGASILWTYGTNFYSEAWQAAAFVWAAVALLKRRSALAAALIAVAGLIKVTGLVFVPGFFAAVALDSAISWTDRQRTLLVLAGAVACACAIHVSWNLYRFGSPLEFGYNLQEMVPVLPAQSFRLWDVPRGLLVQLATPGKSIFLWAPALVLSLMRLRSTPDWLAAGLGISAVCGLVFYAAFLFPEGGYSHGPRHLVPIVPLLLLPAALPGRPLSRQLVFACAAIGVAFALTSTAVSFLQDQSLGTDFTKVGYYERINPPPGRSWLRYRFDYVPFARAMQSGQWPRSREVGAGLDFFWLHLARARAGIPAAAVIPAWICWLLPVGWIALLVGSLGYAVSNNLLGPDIDAKTSAKVGTR